MIDIVVFLNYLIF